MKSIVESDFMQTVDKELLYYLAHRYNKRPDQIISKFLIQDNLCGSDVPNPDFEFILENNESEILRAYYRMYVKRKQ